MYKPMKAHSRLRSLAVMVVAAATLTACNADSSTTPRPAARTPEGAALIPQDANKALYGIVDGVYAVTVYPGQDNNLYLGRHYLSLPANSVCQIGTSAYGADYWNSSCSAQTLPFVLTVTIKGAQSDHPQVDFAPAMRFSPSKTVQLFMYVPGASQTDATNWKMNYCPTLLSTNCIDESKTDASLTTMVDRYRNYVFRRVKHFSGYVIAGRDGEEEPAPTLVDGM